MSERFLNSKALEEKLGFARTKVYRMTRMPGFPKPREIDETSYRWLESEVDKWMHSLKPTEPAKENRAAN